MQYAVIFQMCQGNQTIRTICLSFMGPDSSKNKLSAIRRIINLSLTLYCTTCGFYFEMFFRLPFTSIRQPILQGSLDIM